MKPTAFRSKCPICSGLDLFGDKWSLVVIRDLLYYGERTFKDFVNIEEKISTARLADGLKSLESYGMITKTQHPSNKKVFFYHLTEKGLDLAPLIVELILWSNKHLFEHISDTSKEFARKLTENREGEIEKFRLLAREKAAAVIK